jgi:hypothetical protein
VSITRTRTKLAQFPYNQTYDANNVAQGQSEASAASSRGAAKDVELLGVADLRAMASAWEGLINFAATQSLTLKVLERPLTAIETATLLERPDLAEINLRRLLTDLAQTDEFRTRFVEPMEDRMEEVADAACKRLFDRSADSKESQLFGEICRSYGFNAMIAAMMSSRQYDELFGNDLPRSDFGAIESDPSAISARPTLKRLGTVEGDPSAISTRPTLERRTIDVFRN